MDNELRQQLQDIWISTSGVRLDGPEIDRTIALIAAQKQRWAQEMQKEQVLFMAALLREQGGKLEISRKSFMEADLKDEVIVHDDIARNKVVYELAALDGVIGENNGQ